MTRFARAAGSKASNARVTEEATSWADMKKQLIESQQGQEQSQELQEKIKRAKSKKIEEVPKQWAEFGSDGKLLRPDYLQSQISTSSESKKEKPKKKKKVASNISPVNNVEKKKKKKVIKNTSQDDYEEKKKKQKVINNDSASEKVEKKKKKKIQVETEQSIPNKNEKSDKSFMGTKADYVAGKNPAQQPKTAKKRRAVKEAEGLDPKRRKPLTTKIYVDGREIEIDLYDGFPVLKEDAERLRELKKKMLKEGIPKVEVMKAMKLERRRAEKTLTREKRKVCFHCRQSGHVMSECPKLSTGSCDVCFKCGSTEHKSPQCKVAQGNDYKFGTCFVCGETGHISRQCPDNPRGLYPQGGGCRVCGDVTHLKKDCPQLAQERQESTVTVPSAKYSTSIEALDEDKKAKTITVEGHKKNKIIKF
ncbi:zinc finger CCHC domain-containing protein 9-like [Neocloeon triangulifer]|uniref:zinc finger CCHC domain-containing protein 9-like n=1 Tax=Neocloeon triangulifer TaxID=2078957 RepID=UPI00286F0DC1|nr:zinc finger CCHC domain-containing protein 9-like [Neocloeon triangulifer]